MSSPHKTPTASRPYIPDYGVRDSQSGAGLLFWEWASERLSSSRNYWIAPLKT